MLQDPGAELERPRVGRVVLRVPMHPHGGGAQRQERQRQQLHFGQLRARRRGRQTLNRVAIQHIDYILLSLILYIATKVGIAVGIYMLELPNKCNQADWAHVLCVKGLMEISS